MKLEKDGLKIDRKLSELDKYVLRFVERLEDLGIDYVIISGYVAILTGRSRGTEGIDIIIERIDHEKTKEIFEKIKKKGYWCINAGDSEIYGMLSQGIAVRIAEEDRVIPNFELKFPTDDLDQIALENSIEAIIDSNGIKISPIELQIAYKLYLGSEKDIEDAIHLYQLFKDDIDMEKLENWVKEMKVGDKLDEIKEA